ncbi:hypothetical protein [Mycolicibacterium septicum]|uniref:hypothetical protein n=1 Tax=Mycolicibacterium septicum TaxID=98668 RepID=UPI002361D535|nr:hypothetical protein [Mycolicibacterium septicum]
MNADANEPVPEGFNVPYEYYDPDDMCVRRNTANYVAPPIMSKDDLKHRLYGKEEFDD